MLGTAVVDHHSCLVYMCSKLVLQFISLDHSVSDVWGLTPPVTGPGPGPVTPDTVFVCSLTAEKNTFEAPRTNQSAV